VNITRKAALGGLAITAAGALLLAGCAPAPETGAETPAATDAPEASSFMPCMVSDAGGFDDKSFNELAHTGLVKAAGDLGLDYKAIESAGDAEYAPNINGLVDEGCNLIITVGFALSAATVEAALANPEVEFAILDDAADNDFDGKTDAPNIKPLLFDTAEAAFLGGYTAASYSTSGVVGTFGGVGFPTVSIFMDGFAQGVAYYNEAKGANVQVLGWDVNNPDAGVFVSGDPAVGFAAGPLPLAIAEGFIAQGADVIHPVGGPIFESAAAAIEASGKDVALVGVDADQYLTAPAQASLFLTSVQKLMDAAVYDVIQAAAAGEFDATPYIGTLENGGVGLAPFHDFESKVSPDLQGELDAIAADIMSGKLVVTSYLK